MPNANGPNLGRSEILYGKVISLVNFFESRLYLLTHSHTMMPFDALKIYSCRKHCEKRRACNKQFVLFSQCFLPDITHIFHFQCTLKCHLQFLSNLDQSKNFLSGNGLKSESNQPQLQAIVFVWFGVYGWNSKSLCVF